MPQYRSSTPVYMFKEKYIIYSSFTNWEPISIRTRATSYQLKLSRRPRRLFYHYLFNYTSAYIYMLSQSIGKWWLYLVQFRYLHPHRNIIFSVQPLLSYRIQPFYSANIFSFHGSQLSYRHIFFSFNGSVLSMVCIYTHNALGSSMYLTRVSLNTIYATGRNSERD